MTGHCKGPYLICSCACLYGYLLFFCALSQWGMSRAERKAESVSHMQSDQGLYITLELFHSIRWLFKAHGRPIMVSAVRGLFLPSLDDLGCPIYAVDVIFFPDGTAHMLIDMSVNVRKRTFWYVRPTKTEISLRIRAVWSQSSLSAWKNFASLTIQTTPSEDSDQTANAQADQNLRWAHMSEGTFSDVVAHLSLGILNSCWKGNLVHLGRIVKKLAIKGIYFVGGSGWSNCMYMQIKA